MITQEYEVNVWNKDSSSAKEELEKIKQLHLVHYKEIGQVEDNVLELVKNNNNVIYILKNYSKTIGYAVFELYGPNAYGSWIGLCPKEIQKGNGFFFMREIHKNLKERNITTLNVTTRNRFKSALSIYIKNGFDIYGLSVGDDGDIMINLKLKIS